MPSEKIDEFLFHVFNATWEDIRHSRIQEWKMLEIVGLVFIAMAGLGIQEAFRGLSIIIGLSIMAFSIFGAGMTLRHRKLFAEKMHFLRNIEHHMGLDELDLLPPEWTKRKQVKIIRLWSTSTMMLLIYAALFFSALLYIIYVYVLLGGLPF
ncbi:MAG: hypothetical protein ACFFC7_18235 [Candidatus Hermodarchaeota archaeon]